MRSVFIKQSVTIQSGFKPDSGWVILSPIEAAIKRKIEAVGTPLKNWDINIYRGILTGYNEAFIIDGETKAKLLADSPKNAEIIRPILRGKHIKKYSVNDNESIIFIPCGWTNLNKGNIDPELFLRESFPKIYEHLIIKSKMTSKGKGLFDRDDKGDYWWELRQCAYVDEFSREKIIYIDIMTDNEEDGYTFPCFSYSINSELILNTAYFMVGDKHNLKYIIAILNSKVGRFIVRNFVTQLQQRQYRLFRQNVEMFPIVKAPETIKLKIIENVTNLLYNNIDLIRRKKIEYEIDDIVFNLYNLNIEEKESIGFINT